MINALLALYVPYKYANVIVYMLQSTEYQSGPYLKWFWRTQDFSKVMKRGKLKQTKVALLLVYGVYFGIIFEIAVGLGLIWAWHEQNLAGGWQFGLALIIAYPLIIAHFVLLPLILGRWLIVEPINSIRVNDSEKVFRVHKGIKIAVAGSYGKTTMKELLFTVLSEGKRVAATPANKNVSVSHAIFAKQLGGEEQILIIEYGEGAPGDVSRFAKLTHPDRGVITGLAPAHLDRYKTLEAAGTDIFSLANYVKSKYLYVNEESPAQKAFIKDDYQKYNAEGALGWKVSGIKVRVTGTKFELSKGKKKLNLSSNLLGRHHVGSLAFAAALAKELGLSDEEVEAGVSKTLPFEHRMQPYMLNGAWVVDDTYNGNIEGIRAGTELLSKLSAPRKIYVTPGLVDQGRQKITVHQEVGQLIAKAKPDLVILMKNSVSKYIQEGLALGEYTGQVLVETNPLLFYTNLGQFVAKDDLVMLQNDWPDQYA
jgi:UDP-N-acetylmuramyl pentapeptide synthase